MYPGTIAIMAARVNYRDYLSYTQILIMYLRETEKQATYQRTVQLPRPKESQISLSLDLRL